MSGSPEPYVNAAIGRATWDSQRHQTAIARSGLSMPARQALQDGVLSPNRSVLDFGCGRGLDVRRLSHMGFAVTGWDPHYTPHLNPTPAADVLLLYVLNVIEDAVERRQALGAAWNLASRSLTVAARMEWERSTVRGEAHGDGVLTSRGTFQHLYQTGELRELVESITGARTLVAAPGVVYAFRDDAELMDVIGRRALVTQEWSDASAVGDVLAQVVLFIESTGRTPLFEEVPAQYLAALGSVSIARLSRDAHAMASPAAIQEGAKRSVLETLLFLGIDIFNGRAPLGSLPLPVQANVKAFFSSYREASRRAERLLLKLRDDSYVTGAMRNSVGKLTRTALYIHQRAIKLMPVVLRLYEHCGAVAAGRPSEFDILKLAHDSRTVTWLGYPEFDRDPHPRTAWSYGVDLRTLQSHYVDFTGRENRPLLHRKEEFLSPEDPRAALYAKLTRAEVREGLYTQPHLIGTENGWQQALDRAGVRLQGHRLIRQRS